MPRITLCTTSFKHLIFIQYIFNFIFEFFFFAFFVSLCVNIWCELYLYLKLVLFIYLLIEIFTLLSCLSDPESRFEKISRCPLDGPKNDMLDGKTNGIQTCTSVNLCTKRLFCYISRVNCALRCTCLKNNLSIKKKTSCKVEHKEVVTLKEVEIQVTKLNLEI